MERVRVQRRVCDAGKARAAWARSAVFGALLVAGCAPSPGPAASGAAPAAPQAPGGPVAAPAAPQAAGGQAAAPVATAAVAPIHLLVNYAAVGPSQSGLWATYEGG